MYHDGRYYIPKFQVPCICFKGERMIFVRGPKTYGSPFIFNENRPIHFTKGVVLVVLRSPNSDLESYCIRKTFLDHRTTFDRKYQLNILQS